MQLNVKNPILEFNRKFVIKKISFIDNNVNPIKKRSD